MKSLLAYIYKFGFWRGLEFHRVARKCEADHEKLVEWSKHYRARGASLLRAGDKRNGDALLAFAEILQAEYDKRVLNRRPRQPILSKQQRRIDRALGRLKKKHGVRE